MEREIIQSLWIGSRLSVMEQLSIRSFLAHGYEFHLYAFDEVQGVPAGAKVRPAEEILPAEQVFTYRKGYGKGSFSAFSNCFRYKLLLARGGWWTDLDCVCLRPLEYDEEHVLGYERAPDGKLQTGVSLIKAPAGSRLLKYCWTASQRVDRAEVTWGQIGPRLMDRAVREIDVPLKLLGPRAFYPINYWEVWEFISGAELPEGAAAIHLWNSRWRRERLDPDASYDPHCIYEQLKRRFGVSSPTGSGQGPGWHSRTRHWWRQLRTGSRQAA